MKWFLSILFFLSSILLIDFIFSKPVDNFQNESIVLSTKNFQFNWTHWSQIFDSEIEDIDFDLFIETDPTQNYLPIPCEYQYFAKKNSQSRVRILIPVLIDLPPPFFFS